jgi:hypothetical protein
MLFGAAGMLQPGFNYERPVLQSHTVSIILKDHVTTRRIGIHMSCHRSPIGDALEKMATALELAGERVDKLTFTIGYYDEHQTSIAFGLEMSVGSNSYVRLNRRRFR